MLNPSPSSPKCQDCKFWLRGVRHSKPDTKKFEWDARDHSTQEWDSTTQQWMLIPKDQRGKRLLPYGDCRISPPTLPHYEDGPTFPQTNETDWCGSFKHHLDRD
jgi:hypothetical protein